MFWSVSDFVFWNCLYCACWDILDCMVWFWIGLRVLGYFGLCVQMHVGFRVSRFVFFLSQQGSRFRSSHIDQSCLTFMTNYSFPLATYDAQRNRSTLALRSSCPWRRGWRLHSYRPCQPGVSICRPPRRLYKPCTAVCSVLGSAQNSPTPSAGTSHSAWRTSQRRSSQRRNFKSMTTWPTISQTTIGTWLQALRSASDWRHQHADASGSISSTPPRSPHQRLSAFP